MESQQGHLPPPDGTGEQVWPFDARNILKKGGIVVQNKKNRFVCSEDIKESGNRKEARGFLVKWVINCSINHCGKDKAIPGPDDWYNRPGTIQIRSGKRCQGIDYYDPFAQTFCKSATVSQSHSDTGEITRSGCNAKGIDRVQISTGIEKKLA
jgi:hypothetical protein